MQTRITAVAETFNSWGSLAAMNARLLTAAVALTVGSVVSHADGLPQERAPAQVAGPCCEYVPTPNWSGVYAGLHVGAARSKTGWTFPFDESFNTAAGQNFPISAEGGAVGGHLGVNYQFWRILVGAEVSYTLVDLSDIVIGPIAGSPTDRFKVDERDLFTLTGRLGVTHDKFLLYGKAGFASTIVDVTAFSPTGVMAQATQRANGWIVGGGLDTRIFSDVLLGVEYNYVTLPGERFTSLTNATPAGPFNVDIRDIHMQTIVARLSILFGPNACCHDGLFGKY
jgi:opacity protein-like surface antigen